MLKVSGDFWLVYEVGNRATNTARHRVLAEGLARLSATVDHDEVNGIDRICSPLDCRSTAACILRIT